MFDMFDVQFWAKLWCSNFGILVFVLRLEFKQNSWEDLSSPFIVENRYTLKVHMYIPYQQISLGYRWLMENEFLGKEPNWFGIHSNQHWVPHQTEVKRLLMKWFGQSVDSNSNMLAGQCPNFSCTNHRWLDYQLRIQHWLVPKLYGWIKEHYKAQQ